VGQWQRDTFIAQSSLFMSAEIICVGTELLLGNIVNENAQYLARELARLGIPHYYQTVVGDNPDRLKRAAAIAAERIVLTYGTFGRSLSVEELDTFATTGEQSPSLQAYFRMSRADPQPVRQSLSQPIEADPVLLDRLGAVIQTRSNRANRQALRSALVLSASDDSQMTLLEILQNYPTSELHVKGELLVAPIWRRVEASVPDKAAIGPDHPTGF
jgi:hypothetical protein